MESFPNHDGGHVVTEVSRAILENAGYLSEVDGAIGDGDHGINMKKGFLRFAETTAGRDLGLSEALVQLGTTLFGEIGGSMGPLYGGFFKAMGKTAASRERIDPECFLAMLRAGVASVTSIGEAKVGDKTMLDALLPGVEAFAEAIAEGSTFAEALERMAAAAKHGMELTKEMVAKVGRASRLGDRSRGVQDAGATSCYLILDSMRSGILRLLK